MSKQKNNNTNEVNYNQHKQTQRVMQTIQKLPKR